MDVDNSLPLRHSHVEASVKLDVDFADSAGILAARRVSLFVTQPLNWVELRGFVGRIIAKQDSHARGE